MIAVGETSDAVATGAVSVAAAVAVATKAPMTVLRRACIVPLLIMPVECGNGGGKGGGTVSDVNACSGSDPNPRQALTARAVNAVWKVP
ncbi:hypothetical protein GCM10010452_27640 [Crossiella cryophila]